jgi:hypothetical protein
MLNSERRLAKRDALEKPFEDIFHFFLDFAAKDRRNRTFAGGLSLAEEYATMILFDSAGSC